MALAKPNDMTDHESDAAATTEMSAVIAARLGVLTERIEAAGGSPDSTRVLAVTKTFPAAVCRAAVGAGLTELGENYGQELEEKGSALAEASVRWHFIGGLQRNKVKKIADFVAVWQTVDRESLVTEIAKRAPGATVYLQVNTTGEPQKSGVEPGETARLLEHARSSGLTVPGLMTIGPTDGSDPGPAFSSLRTLADRLGLPERSMGMTNDLERAVQEGSTMVRIGTALFGGRTRVDG